MTLEFIARHPLGSKRPLAGFWRYFRWQIESRIRREVEFDWIEGSKLVVRNGMAGATGNIYCGLHEFTEMAFLLHLLRPDDLFIDVGANVGSYTVLASAVCGACSIAFEPDPGSAQALRRNVQCNRIERLVVVIQSALGAATDTTRFTVGLDTMNRVASADDKETQAVPVTTLDAQLEGKNPLFIKIDVEGHEAQVIFGATTTLRNPSLLALQLESVDAGVETFLEDIGFRRAAYDPFSRRLSSVIDDSFGRGSQNTLFVRNHDIVQARLQASHAHDILGHLI